MEMSHLKNLSSCIIVYQVREKTPEKTVLTTKTIQVERQLLEAIRKGEYPVGAAIPSRNRLTARWQCSRTVIERAVSSLAAAGYLEGRKGSGTYVSSRAPVRSVGELRIVAVPEIVNYREFSFFDPAEHTLGASVVWVPPARAERDIRKLARPGGAVLWILPGYDKLPLMNYLHDRHIPQLILNRDFHGFDCVQTDPVASIRDGLSWLLIEAGRKIAFLAARPTLKIPYQYDRMIAFYQLCVELGVRLEKELCAVRPFDDIPGDIAEVGAHIFGVGGVPGIFVLTKELALPLVICARGYGRLPGRDYKLLVFDEVPELAGRPGIAMIKQPFDLFHSEVRRWLKGVAAGTDQGRFFSNLKAELLVP